METIGKIIVIAIALVVGYALLHEYLSEEDIRPVYHLFIGGAIIIGLMAMCINGCGG